MGKLVFISLSFFKKNLFFFILRNNFLFLEVLLTRFSVPKMTYVTVLRFLLYTLFLFLREYGADSLIWNTPFIIGSDSPFKTLNISITKVRIFLWCILKELSLSKNSSSLPWILNTLFLMLFPVIYFFLLLRFFEWNIQISWELLN